MEKEMRPRFLLLFIVGLAVLSYGMYYVSFSYFKSEEIRKASGRLSLYKSSLLSEIERFVYFPFVLSQDPYVISALSGEGVDRLNERLAKFADQSGVEAIYLMDTTGLTVSSSNYASKTSYIGQNYAFRPYFKDALAGNHGEFYGIGATTKLPGLFISEPVRDVQGQVIGVIALKLNFGQLENLWIDSDEQVLLGNKDSVILLSSNPNWRYRAMFAISKERRQEIQEERQFANEPLNELNWRIWNENQVMVEGNHFLLVTEEMDSRNWTLYFFASQDPVQEKTWMTLISAFVILTIVFAVIQFRRTVRIGEALRESQADSAAMREANRRLAVEIEERKVAEKRLKTTQNELARASRLAALGQLAVSVTHELGQPLAAMRNYLTAAEMSPNPPAMGFMQKMTGLALRMENITKQLKFFAKPGSETFEAVDMRDVLKGAEELLQADFVSNAINYKRIVPNTAVVVHANRLRLEQVLTNLMRNALNAMEAGEERLLTVQLSMENAQACVEVFDTGAGLGKATLEELQEPFVSTRASGEGLGLGLAISSEIVKEHGGRMAARNRQIKGAAFRIELPLWAED
ncbi:two-component sensor histidine kinase [Terasakiella brassicae]|uniref:histidine kinase n=2 Tax=Terasakiella brassicae TaxID=1634917 RepID=A0A917FBG6_9PROT|nr:two-component sensor histidine kinase [Terasakiella brassicae]